MTDDELALRGLRCWPSLSGRLACPTPLPEMGITDKAVLKKAADSCGISAGGYKKMTHEEIYQIFMECYE